MVCCLTSAKHPAVQPDYRGAQDDYFVIDNVYFCPGQRTFQLHIGMFTSALPTASSNHYASFTQSDVAMKVVLVCPAHAAVD